MNMRSSERLAPVIRWDARAGAGVVYGLGGRNAPKWKHELKGGEGFARLTVYGIANSRDWGNGGGAGEGIQRHVQDDV